MLLDSRKAIRPASADEVRLVARSDATNPAERTMGAIEWTAAWSDQAEHGWPLVVWYPARDKPGLFYEIARSVTTPEGALDAFRAYGPLLYDHNLGWRLPMEGEGFILEERVYDWIRQAQRMAEARDWFRALDDARQGSYARLAKRCGTRGASPSELVAEGEERVLRYINSTLRDTVYLEVQPTAKPGEVILEDSASVTLGYAPRNLLGSAWLMFAREVVGETIIKECDNCHTYFSREAKGVRSELRFCSDKCRNRAWVRDNRKGKHAEESKGE